MLVGDGHDKRASTSNHMGAVIVIKIWRIHYSTKRPHSSLGYWPPAPVELIWRNDELNAPPSQRPAGFREEQRMQGWVVEVGPPKKLTIAWDGFGEVC